MKDIKYYNENDKTTLNKVIEIAEELDFGVNVCNNTYNDEKAYVITFSKYTDCGQDFSFEIEVSTYFDLDDVWSRVDNYYESYDVSYEAYLWLDEDGHGKNGAPYEMIDVYNDMKQCERYIKELADKLLENL